MKKQLSDKSFIGTIGIVNTRKIKFPLVKMNTMGEKNRKKNTSSHSPEKYPKKFHSNGRLKISLYLPHCLYRTLSAHPNQSYSAGCVFRCFSYN